jgi:exodeoxyribonuclease VII large subunit
MRLIEKRTAALNTEAKMLETLSYQATLKRGYALVRGTDGRLIRSAEIAAGTDEFKVSFADGDVTASPAGSGAAKAQGRAPQARPAGQPVLVPCTPHRSSASPIRKPSSTASAPGRSASSA